MAVSLSGKTIILGAGGSIATYKLPILVSSLVKEGATVHPVVTRGALRFVTREALATMSKQEVWHDSFDKAPPGMIPHIDLAKAADLLLIAPASANLIAKLACGMADDMLTDIALAATCPKLLVPAMNTHMYENAATQSNLQTLRARGWQVMDAASGELACGDVGKGKLPELADIIQWTKDKLARDSRNDLAGHHIVVTAGPTQEKLDPVRYITNHSTGKMGYALAEAALKRGAEVTLISGPVQVTAPAKAKLRSVVSAAEMAAAVHAAMPEADMLIMAAAVADYTPVRFSEQKIKKSVDGGEETLVLKRTEDILATVGKTRRAEQIMCGFAMETEQLFENAQKKLQEKGLDLICANSLAQEGAGFAVDTNVLTLIDRNNSESLPLMSKAEAADRILDWLLTIKAERNQK